MYRQIGNFSLKHRVMFDWLDECPANAGPTGADGVGTLNLSAGTEKAAALGIAPFSAILLGMLSSVGGGAIRDVVVRRRVPQVFGGNTLTATCAAASAVVTVVAYRLQHPEAGLVGGTARIRSEPLPPWRSS